MWRKNMNRVIPHYQITENNKDFPEWGVKILSGDFADIEFVVDREVYRRALKELAPRHSRMVVDAAAQND